jgi:hypothetical protein
MNPVDPNTGKLPPSLRALAMGLVVETVVPMLGRSQHKNGAAAGHGARGDDAGPETWRDLRWKCDELMGLVLQTDDPQEAATYVLGYLPKHFDRVFELLSGQRREHVTNLVVNPHPELAS